MKNIICSNCNELIAPQKLRRNVLKGLAYEFYWFCPECDFKHISYYTDQKIRRDIKRQEKRWERYRNQLDIYDNLLMQVDSYNNDKDALLSDKELEVIPKLEQCQAEIRKLEAQIKMEDKLIKKDMDGLYKRMQKALT